MPKKIKSAVVTGASSGIGEQFARELARRDLDYLLISARRTERLEALRKELEQKHLGLRVEILTADLCERNGRAALVEAICREPFSLDLLVNNAGFGSVGSFCDLALERELSMISLNCQASIALCHAAATKMKAQGGGHIINVCSTGAYQPLPYMATYGATKSFLYSFSLSLAEELKGTGVHVMAHCPGPTESEFHIGAGLTKKLDFVDGMQAAPVVREALDAMLKEKRVCINGRKNTLLAIIAKIVPSPLSAYLVASRLKSYRKYTEG